MEKYNYWTCFHVCCQKGYWKNLEILLEYSNLYLQSNRDKYENYNVTEFVFDLENNDVFSLNLVFLFSINFRMT